MSLGGSIDSLLLGGEKGCNDLTARHVLPLRLAVYADAKKFACISSPIESRAFACAQLAKEAQLVNDENVFLSLLFYICHGFY